MEKESKIYIAGHRGLVGSAILEQVKKRGYSNLVYRSSRELDLRRQKETEEFFDKEKPECVFLAAAKVGGILANNTYKAEFIYNNLAIAVNVINSAYRSGVKKLLNLGSSCIYPRECQQPMREEFLLSGPLEPTNEPYAIAKISAIKLCRYYNEQYRTNYISVMPTNLYGPHDNFNLETSHVLAALIRKFHLAKLMADNKWEMLSRDIGKTPIGFGIDREINYDDEKSIEEALSKVGVTKEYVLLWGSGEPYREFMYVEDMADACVFLMENVDANDMKALCDDYFVNVGVGEDIKIKDLARLIADIVGFDGEIRFDKSKPDGVYRKLLDVNKIKELGWEAKTSLSEGVKKTYEWYEKVLRDG